MLNHFHFLFNFNQYVIRFLNLIKICLNNWSILPKLAIRSKNGHYASLLVEKLLFAGKFTFMHGIFILLTNITLTKNTIIFQENRVPNVEIFCSQFSKYLVCIDKNKMHYIYIRDKKCGQYQNFGGSKLTCNFWPLKNGPFDNILLHFEFAGKKYEVKTTIFGWTEIAGKLASKNSPIFE